MEGKQKFLRDNGEVKDVEKEKKKGLKKHRRSQGPECQRSTFNVMIVDLLEPLGLFFFFFTLQLPFFFVPITIT